MLALKEDDKDAAADMLKRKRLETMMIRRQSIAIEASTIGA